jgi:hypothetical protein
MDVIPAIGVLVLLMHADQLASSGFLGGRVG